MPPSHCSSTRQQYYCALVLLLLVLLRQTDALKTLPVPCAGPHCYSVLAPCAATATTTANDVADVGAAVDAAAWDYNATSVTSLRWRANPDWCLNVDAWGTQEGDIIWSTTCHPEAPAKMQNRVWHWTAAHGLENPAAHLCLDAKAGASAKAGAHLQLSPCGGTTGGSVATTSSSSASSSSTSTASSNGHAHLQQRQRQRQRQRNTPSPSVWAYDATTGHIHNGAGLCVALSSSGPPPPPPPAPPLPPTPPPPPFTARASVNVSTASPVARTAHGFVSFNFDWHKDDEEPPVWERMSVQKIDLDRPALRAAAAAMAPARLRVGGSEGDHVIYNITGTECTGSDPALCLNMTRWAELVAFCDATGLNLVFGLNAMTRANNSAPANLTNHDAFLGHIASRGQHVYGFEFGNELPHVDPEVMASDFIALAGLLAKHWPDARTRPRLIGNDLNTNPSYLSKFLPLAGHVLDAVTYHDYVGYGLDPALARKIPTVSFLDGVWGRAAAVQAQQLAHAPAAE
eukprot:UC1_evm1s1987